MLAMKTDETKVAPQKIFLKDYTPPAYLVSETNLVVEIDNTIAEVSSSFEIQANPKSSSSGILTLYGFEVEVVEIKIDGKVQDSSTYQQVNEEFRFSNVPEKALVEIRTRVDITANKTGLGLYKSDDTIVTQMEPEGFRRITLFPDRPDVLSIFTTKVIGDLKQYPQLLANGNLIDSGKLEGGKHYAVWEDPHPKPCYLFALVAGNLVSIEDTYVRKDGKSITLQIFVEKINEGKSDFAMDSLKRSMKWDEDVFGFEYDLDLFMIVAVDAFNFGAMENKGLNIFNAKYILASPETATDTDVLGVEAVVAHEYFHNWTGNRITCQNWFQLTLKEGLTVFRDQWFSGDMHSHAVKRIEEVTRLRNYQFPEDAGPNAHPIRPESFIEIDNFYTATVYEKGSEIVRMVCTLIGQKKFLEGILRYRELFDGQAVTTEDFIQAMHDVSGRDFSQFMRWYDQAGTPVVSTKATYDDEAKTYTLNFSQTCPATPEKADKDPFVIPIVVGLLDSQGKDISLSRTGLKDVADPALLEMTEKEQSFTFENVSEAPTPSLLRNFSAPVRLEFDYSDENLLFLYTNDSDEFNRFEAGQRILLRELRRLMGEISAGKEPTIPVEIFEALCTVLQNDSLHPQLRAKLVHLPSLSRMVSESKIYDYVLAYRAKKSFLDAFASTKRNELEEVYGSFHDLGEFKTDDSSMGARSIKNRALAILSVLDDKGSNELVRSQLKNATNMTDEYAALSCACSSNSSLRDEAAAAFREKWKAESLVMNKWFVAQALSSRSDTLERVVSLAEDPLFDRFNPNKVRSLFSAYTQNEPQFHREDGASYAVIVDRLLHVDTYNPSVASRLSKSFSEAGRLDKKRQAAIKRELERAITNNKLSKASFEIITNTLKGI